MTFSFSRSFLGVLASLAFSQAAFSAPHVVIDPGHGGSDRGATRQGIFESTIALAVAKQLSERLEKRGYKVTLTREKDQTISLENRALVANRSKADLFVSIHLNSSMDARAQGKEFYFQNQLPVDEEAQYLASRENAEAGHSHEVGTGSAIDRMERAGLPQAEAAQLPDLNIGDANVRSDVKRILADLTRNDRVRRSSELAKTLYNEWKQSAFAGTGSSRAIRQAPFFLVSNIAAPSVLVEIGFLSHKREGVRMQQPEYQAALADSLAAGISKFLNRP